MRTLTIANLTFREAWRKKLFWMALGLGLAFILLFAIGFHFIVEEISTHPPREARQGEAAMNLFINQVSGMLLLFGLFALNFLIVMMAALTSAGAISGEIASHTIQAIATKPIRRWQIVMGKWLGQTVMLIGYIVFMVLGLILVVYLKTGYTPPNIAAGIALLALEGLIVLSLTTFGGTFLPTLANGVLVFMLYGLAFIGSWVEQIGAALNSDTAVQVGIIAGFIMPSETMWRMVSDLMQPAVVREIGASPLTLYSQPSQAMIVYAVFYIVVLMSGALLVFSKRDL